MTMPDNPLVAPHVVVAPAAPVAGDTLPVPTPEQERAADQLFARPEEQHHAALDLLGMVASVQFLHDLANETFRRAERDRNDPELDKKPDGCDHEPED
jgi:hypothetical protein